MFFTIKSVCFIHTSNSPLISHSQRRKRRFVFVDNARIAQYRQSGTERRGGYHPFVNGGASSVKVAIGIRNGGGTQHEKPGGRWRRSPRLDRTRRFAVGSVVFDLCLVLVLSVSAYYYISGYTNFGKVDKGIHSYDGDFLTNVSRTDPLKILKFGHGSVLHGRDTRDIGIRMTEGGMMTITRMT